jgi:hypothetical protein
MTLEETLGGIGDKFNSITQDKIFCSAAGSYFLGRALDFYTTIQCANSAKFGIDIYESNPLINHLMSTMGPVNGMMLKETLFLGVVAGLALSFKKQNQDSESPFIKNLGSIFLYAHAALGVYAAIHNYLVLNSSF